MLQGEQTCLESHSSLSRFPLDLENNGQTTSAGLYHLDMSSLNMEY